VSASDILSNMSRGWNREPNSVALGSTRTGVSAALWTHHRDDVQEVFADPSYEHHLVGLQISPFSADTFYDGRFVFGGRHGSGSFNVVPAGIQPRAVIRGTFKSLHIYLPTKLVAGLAGDLGVSAGTLELINPKAGIDPLVRRIGQDILEEMQVAENLSRLRVDVLGQDLSIQLIRRWSNLAGTPVFTREPARGGLAPWQVKRVSDYLQANLASDTSLADLASLVDLSTEHFCRAFKVSTGLPPHAWLVARRVERARELLEGTNLPVEEIAAEVGYAEPSHLARIFRRAHGVSPTQYRRERRS
jgi:AraC family transcriptional regulator